MATTTVAIIVASALLALLLGHSDSSSASAGGLGVLTAHTNTPVVSKATVGADLLETLEILAELVVERVRGDLRVLAVLVVLLSVEEPVGYLVLARVRHDRDDAVDLLLGQLTGALVHVHVRFAQTHEREASTHTLDGCHGERHLDFTVDVRVHHTENVLEFLWHD